MRGEITERKKMEDESNELRKEKPDYKEGSAAVHAVLVRSSRGVL
jgi:hypothetical protein